MFSFFPHVEHAGWMNLSYYRGFPDSSVGKESACNAGDPGSIRRFGRSAGEGKDYPLQYSWASLVAQLVRIHLQFRRPWFNSWAGKIPWRRDGLPTPVFLGFPGGSDDRESTCNEGHLGLIPGLERSPGGGHDNPLQCSCLENRHGQRNPGYSSCGRKESDTTERLSTHTHTYTHTHTPILRNLRLQRL